MNYLLNMTKTILKNLFTKPETIDFPKKQRDAFGSARGHIDIQIDECIFCGICSKKCPASAINVNKEQKSWEIDRYKCVTCDYCREVCPKKCIVLKTDFIKSSVSKEKYVTTKQEQQEHK